LDDRKRHLIIWLTIWRGAHVVLLTLAVSVAQTVAKEIEFHPELNAPVQQSKCEVAANKFKAEHPHLDMFDKRNIFWMPYGDATPPRSPFSFSDQISGVALYVERDGRHVSARSLSGKLLWVRNPFVDSDMCPYRSAHPFIHHIGAVSDPSHPWPQMHTDAGANALIYKDVKRVAAFMMKNRLLKELPSGNDRYLGISFNSSQSGFINLRNGDFYFMGQN
jgi:hypothetical protein